MNRLPHHPHRNRWLIPSADASWRCWNSAAAGLTNREIAHRLFITVGTVKRHINNIYGKLEARHRAEAVARARDLGLLA